MSSSREIAPATEPRGACAAISVGFRAASKGLARFRAVSVENRIASGVVLAGLAAAARFAFADPLGERLSVTTFYAATQLAALVGGLSGAAAATSAWALLSLSQFDGLGDWTALGVALVPAVLTALVLEGVRTHHDEERSRRVESEEQTRRAEGQRMAAMERLVARLAHEINQPLTAAGAYLQAARRKAARAGAAVDAEGLIDPLERASRQLSRAARIIAGWRDSVGMDAPQPTPISLHDVIRDAVETIRAGVDGTAGVDLRLEAACDLVLGDRRQLELALTELMREAMKAGRTRIVVATSSRDGEILIEIRGGESCAAADAARAIVAAHHGRLRMERRPDGGASIVAALPLLKEGCE